MINNDNSSKIIGKRIKESRKNANMTQSELGNALGGLSYQMIGQYESGARKPKRERIEEIARILDVNPRYLTGESNKPKPSLYIIKKDGSKDYIDTSIISSAMDLYTGNRSASDILFDQMMQQIVLRSTLPEQEYNDLIKDQNALPVHTSSYKIKTLDIVKNLNEEGWKELFQYAKYLATKPKYQIDSKSQKPTEEE